MREERRLAKSVKYYFLAVETLIEGLKLLFSSPKITFTYLATIVLFLNQSNRMTEFTVSFTMMTFTVGMLAIMTAINAEEKVLKNDLIDIAQYMIFSGIFLIFSLFFKLTTNTKEIPTLEKLFPEFSSLFTAYSSLSFLILYIATTAASSAAFTFGILDLYNLMTKKDLKNHL